MRSSIAPWKSRNARTNPRHADSKAASEAVPGRSTAKMRNALFTRGIGGAPGLPPRVPLPMRASKPTLRRACCSARRWGGTDHRGLPGHQPGERSVVQGSDGQVRRRDRARCQAHTRKPVQLDEAGARALGVGDQVGRGLRRLSMAAWGGGVAPGADRALAAASGPGLSRF